jgi:hypothetical protein
MSGFRLAPTLSGLAESHPEQPSQFRPNTAIARPIVPSLERTFGAAWFGQFRARYGRSLAGNDPFEPNISGRASPLPNRPCQAVPNQLESERQPPPMVPKLPPPIFAVIGTRFTRPAAQASAHEHLAPMRS